MAIFRHGGSWFKLLCDLRSGTLSQTQHILHSPGVPGFRTSGQNNEEVLNSTAPPLTAPTQESSTQ